MGKESQVIKVLDRPCDNREYSIEFDLKPMQSLIMEFSAEKKELPKKEVKKVDNKKQESKKLDQKKLESKKKDSAC